jgi:hypothetical protein
MSSSTAKSTTGGRFQARPKGKQVPHAGLHILAKDGSNETVWREALYAYAEARFSSVGRDFVNGKRFVRTKPTLDSLRADYDELSADGLQSVLAKEVGSHIKLLRKDADDEGALFVVVVSVTRFCA